MQQGRDRRGGLDPGFFLVNPDANKPQEGGDGRAKAVRVRIGQLPLMEIPGPDVRKGNRQGVIHGQVRLDQVLLNQHLLTGFDQAIDGTVSGDLVFLVWVFLLDLRRSSKGRSQNVAKQ